jgi:hypothetical protein
VGNELVLFAKTGELLPGPLDITVSGSDPVRVVLTDLAPGFWAPQRDAKVTCEAEATAAGHAICLRLDPGTYRLVRSPQRSLAVPAVTHLVPPSVDATVPEVIDGIQPLAVSGVVRETGGRPLVSLFKVVSALGGGEAGWYNSVRRFEVGGVKTDFVPGKREARSGGVEVLLSHAVEEEGGHLWGDLDALSLVIRRPCRWDPASSVVIVDRLADGQLFVQQATTGHTEKGRGADRAIDRNPRTYWASAEDGAWLQLDFGATQSVAAMGIDWLHSDTRRVRFEVLASVDGQTWQEIFAGQSDGRTRGVERVSLPATNARYLRIVGHGNDKNDWNSICELTAWRK